ncbi:MAG TPA: penicillin-binding protein 2 [Gaiellaceae bacterium]|jgi:cell division protein FtsI/penicillin-binding protein 2|nr:penicillin-binding protein 2 [Gaiellaceae bacterium]
MRRRRPSTKVSDRRIRWLLVVFGAVFAITLIRAAWLQTVQASSLAGKEASQQHETVTVPAGRGTIYDRTGVQLAIGEQATTVYANPREVVNPRKVADAAARILGVDANALYPQLTDRSKWFVYVAREADPEKALALKQLHLAGVNFYPEQRRYYPLGPVGSQVIGYAGIDNSGLAGMELENNSTLTGRAGRETVIKDPHNRVVDVLDSVPERDGHDVFLTLDHTIQSEAEDALREAVLKWHAKRATATVLDPHTGAVLAMATAPGFDANSFGSVSPQYQRNSPVTDVYEPGSTFKLVTVAAALTDHLVTPTTSFTLPPCIQVADKCIHDAETRGTETMSVGQILARSSNVGVITIAGLVGPDRLASWISRFGFGHDTGIDYPGESPGIVLPRDKWYGSTVGTIPIGLGVAVTPIQLAAAYAAVANGGVSVTPHLVDHAIEGPQPKIRKRRVLSPAIAKELMAMLVNVVDEGTGTLAHVPGYIVAGKTGTANKPDPQTGGYSTTKYVASFVGIVPATTPRLVILVTVDEPQGAIFGGTVAAPVFEQIARFDLQYLGVQPDNPTDLSQSSTIATASTTTTTGTSDTSTTAGSTAGTSTSATSSSATSASSGG